MLINRTVLAVKIESTYGTDPTPAATDAVLVEDITPPSSEGLRMIERPAVRANLSKLKPTYGGRLATVSFSCELKGSGSAGTAPETDALFRACAMASTVVPATSVTYKPASTGHESVTMYYYLDGTLHVLTGCRGSYTLQLETGNKPMATFTMTGHVADPTDTAIITPTYDSTVPSALIGVPFSIGAYSAIINSLSFDMGNTIATPPDISAADGYGEVRVTEFAPTGSIDPENTVAGTNDWYDDFTSTNAMALTTGAIGGTAGNILTISMPAVTYTDIGHGDRDGVATLETPFMAADSSGDDFISLAFT